MKSIQQQIHELAIWLMEESGKQWDMASNADKEICFSLATKLNSAGYANVAEYEKEIDRLIGVIAGLNEKVDGNANVKMTQNDVKMFNNPGAMDFFPLWLLLTSFVDNIKKDDSQK